ncbi:MAG: DUF3105 domain-containing protein [Actinomycetia bacterium]|nr:DUF3105 domain-containing protein [Actinomycetes bacterium]
MSSKTSRQSGKKPPAQAAGSSPWPKRFVWIGGTALVVGLVAVVFLNNPAIRGVPDGTEQVAVAAAVHVDGDLHDDGEVPAGGPHDGVWQNCGFYDAEVRSENAVHSLEHGAVWITYEPGLAEDQLRTLRGFTGGLDKVLVSPVAGQGSPIIVTAWANQLELIDADDARLAQFVNEFEGSFDAPEPGGRCNGGIGTPTA